MPGVGFHSVLQLYMHDFGHKPHVRLWVPIKNSGSLAVFIIVRANLTSMQFIRSAMPFWDGEYGAVICISIPFA